MTQLFISNLKIMYRNRQTAFWALFFPLLLVTVFGLFNMNEYSKSKIGILDLAQSESSSRLINELNKLQGWNLFIEDEPNTLQNKLESGAANVRAWHTKTNAQCETKGRTRCYMGLCRAAQSF